MFANTRSDEMFERLPHFVGFMQQRLEFSCGGRDDAFQTERPENVGCVPFTVDARWMHAGDLGELDGVTDATGHMFFILQSLDGDAHAHRCYAFRAADLAAMAASGRTTRTQAGDHDASCVVLFSSQNSELRIHLSFQTSSDNEWIGLWDCHLGAAHAITRSVLRAESDKRTPTHSVWAQDVRSFGFGNS